MKCYSRLTISGLRENVFSTGLMGVGLIILLISTGTLGVSFKVD